MKPVSTSEAPAPAGHYSQAIVFGGLAFVSGQLPVDRERNILADRSVGEQTEVVLRNVDAILRAAGSGLDRLLQVTIYVTDVSHWDEVNEVYTRVMGDHRPARAVVPVGPLHHGVALEVQAVAAVAPSV